SRLLIRTCHRRGAFAMGGMAAQIPNRRDPEANEAALAKVTADKEREVREGHDGTWVAHPDLVPVAKDVFDRDMAGPNQLGKAGDMSPVTQADLLEIHDGERTEAGLRENIRVGVQYIEAWLGGRGAVPLYNLMEDAATAEICRSQIWQQLRFGAELVDGRKVTTELFKELLADEMATLRETLGAEAYDSGHFSRAVPLFASMSTSQTFEEFLTLPAYRLIA
ncbi:MAG: malate synthase A, partial [Hyphomicrobiales bacterium]